MEIITVKVGMIGTNCYLAHDGNAAAVIDPGDAPEKILTEAERHHLKIEAVLFTHTHFDHILAAPAVLAATGAKLYCPGLDAPALSDPGVSMLSFVSMPKNFSLIPDRLLDEGDAVEVGNLHFTVWHTPGHTPGSSCYLCGDTLFSGDTLFFEECGRCDLPGGNFTEMKRSLTRITAWPGDLRVLPGHDQETTLAHERAYNPYINA